MRLENVPRVDLLQTLEELLQEMESIAELVGDDKLISSLVALREQLEEMMDED